MIFLSQQNTVQVLKYATKRKIVYQQSCVLFIKSAFYGCLFLIICLNSLSYVCF